MVPLTPFLWPALAAATASEMVSAFAKELAQLAAGDPSNSVPREPRWTTPNRVALELPSMRLREFSADDDDIATLVCAPLALHDAEEDLARHELELLQTMQELRFEQRR